MRVRGIAALAATIGLAGPADAATNIQVTFSLPVYAQINGLNDVTFTAVPTNTDAVNSQSTCAWTNSLTRSYRITASGDGGSGTAFSLSATGGRTVAYQVGWAGTSGASSTTALTTTVASPTFTSAALTPTCTTGPSSSSTLRVTILAADLQGMTSSLSYTGTLTLLMSPM